MNRLRSLKVKVIVVMILFTVLLSVSTVFVSYDTYTDSFNEHYEKLATSISKTTSSVVDPDMVSRLAAETAKTFRTYCDEKGGAPDFESLSEDEIGEYYSRFEYITEMPEYAELLGVLSKLREDNDDNDVVSIYIGYTDVEMLKDLYIADASIDEPCVPGDFDVVEDPEHIAKVRKGDYEFAPFVTNYEEYGWLQSASSPIIDSEGNTVGVALVDISMNKMIDDRSDFLVRTGIIIAVVAVVMFVIIIFLTDKAILKPINKMGAAANGYLKAKKENPEGGSSAFEGITIKTGDEIENLFKSVRRMEEDINTYISELTEVTAEKERIGAELDIATHIQSSMLPSVFPAFPERAEFDIYASMTPAKEVGGDFYDFFLIDDNRLALVMADVSGKGVPAALFMVIAKTLIKTTAQNGLSAAKILEEVNNRLCENNDAGMFVTAWIGILELSTGKMTCANAGHEYPVIKRRGGKYELLKDKHGFVLAGMENMRYKEYDITLEKGDRVFVYTDGVPEATDGNNALFGTDRMTETLNLYGDSDCKGLLDGMYRGIGEFIGDAPQFDDITMLALEYKGSSASLSGAASLKLSPKEDGSMEKAIAFVEENAEKNGISQRISSKLCIAVDEIYSNIVRYSGADESELSFEVVSDTVKLTFSDNGTPYDPLKNEDPDTTLGSEERKLGGLGIFMVKKSMDNVTYEYKDGKNVLSIEKKL